MLDTQFIRNWHHTEMQLPAILNIVAQYDFSLHWIMFRNIENLKIILSTLDFKIPNFLYPKGRQGKDLQIQHHHLRQRLYQRLLPEA